MEDLLGLKPYAEPIRIVTEGVVRGAEAFLSRVCNPALEEIGLLLQDRVRGWRGHNAAKILNGANEKLKELDSHGTEKVHPRLVHVAVEEGSWCDEEAVQEMWAGLLASSTSADGRSDENLIFMNILKQLSSLQVEVLRFAVERAEKFDGGFALPHARDLTMTCTDLISFIGCSDLQRLDRELDHLRELGLLREGGILAGTNNVRLQPSPLALHLYVRGQGSKLSPVEFWKLRLEQPVPE